MGVDNSTSQKPGTGPKCKTLIECLLCALLVCIGWFSVSIPCFGQENQRVEGPSPPVASQDNSAKTAGQDSQSTEAAPPKAEPKKKKKPSRGAFVVAPLPISSPAIGTGLVPVVGYIFPFSTKDKVSPPSTIGAAGLITNNGSRGFAVGGQLFFDEDRYEITSGFVHGNVNYNIYGTGDAT